jgi:hypothetical protein
MWLQDCTHCKSNILREIRHGCQSAPNFGSDGDLDGDGKDDILYRNDLGYFYSWNMNGTSIASEGLLQGAARWAAPSIAVV